MLCFLNINFNVLLSTVSLSLIWCNGIVVLHLQTPTTSLLVTIPQAEIHLMSICQGNTSNRATGTLLLKQLLRVLEGM